MNQIATANYIFLHLLFSIFQLFLTLLNIWILQSQNQLI